MKIGKKEVVDILKQQEINGEELKGLISARENKKAEFILVDVREKAEYQEKRIIGVDYLISSLNFFKNLEPLEKYKEKIIITQCRSGVRSYQAQQILKELGYNTVINLKGGILDYPGKVI